jgi:mannose-1-phosphate guanylyltransferase/mannose-6-phosphate isomerase
MIDLRPVILAGGSGSRLWPLSRDEYPKQLLALRGRSTLLQDTALRLDGLAESRGEGEPPSVLPATVVSNEEHRYLLLEQLEAVGRGPYVAVLEPVGRNTAPALAVAALLEQAEGRDPVLLVMPADHLIEDGDAFLATVRAGLDLAHAGDMVTFGVVPTRAETGYGYIERGEGHIERGKPGGGAYPIRRFVEKPDAVAAEGYLASGRHLWNSGMFMVRASTWLRALERLRPEIAAACRASVEHGSRDGAFFRVEAASFDACPSDSIDYAVMERLCPGEAGEEAQEVEPGLPRGVVVPLDAGWSDIGSWDALLVARARDAAGNSVQGDVFLHEARDSLVIAGSRLVVGLGLREQIVVETADAVLVADRARSQDVRKAVAWLKTQGRSEGRVHRRVYRPWGHVEQLDDGERFEVKRLTLKPGGSLSLQRHHHRAEHWVVVRGTAEVTRGEETFMLSENESAFIPLGTPHRLANPGKVQVEVIEVRSGSYLGEDDIERLDEPARSPAIAD